MRREPWLYYNQDDDCYYSADGKICSGELIYAKYSWPPRSALGEGMETYRGRNAIRKIIWRANNGSTCIVKNSTK